MAAKRTRRDRFTILKRRTAHIHGAVDGANNLPIHNELEKLFKRIDCLYQKDLDVIEQLMLLCYDEGKSRGAKNARTDATTLPDRCPSHEDALAEGRKPKSSERDSDDPDEGGDTTRQAIFFHGHLL